MANRPKSNFRLGCENLKPGQSFSLAPEDQTGRERRRIEKWKRGGHVADEVRCVVKLDGTLVITRPEREVAQ